jgi:hypothetical protein
MTTKLIMATITVSHAGATLVVLVSVEGAEMMTRLNRQQRSSIKTACIREVRGATHAPSDTDEFRPVTLLPSRMCGAGLDAMPPGVLLDLPDGAEVNDRVVGVHHGRDRRVWPRNGRQLATPTIGES